ncbi:AP-3 complex subunit beta, partial [Cyclospora cayetanensis]|uniref:AP-3 complex subunit beta n=1 Tax=Cyclospora cayetanensis TaxID=88456 RepID=A0A6P6S093_9EIME
MEQVGKVRSATQAAAAPLVQKASDGVRALLKLVSTGESSYFKEGDVQVSQIKQQLSSANTETKLVGLRRAIAAEAACGSAEFGEGSSSSSLFFADVLKNLSTSDFELKRLVYLYLVQHAHEHPDLTLLSINGYQKDLYSASHVVRAAALKSLSSLSMLEIVQLLVSSLKRAAADTSPLVRKTAAHAAAKIYYLDTDQREETVGVLLQLLGDGEIAVLGAALISFRLIFFQSLLAKQSSSEAPGFDGGPLERPSFGRDGDETTGIFSAVSQQEALALLHPFYGRLVAVLPQLQPAPQVVAVDLLTRYCRCFFRQPRPLEGTSEDTSNERGEGLDVVVEASPDGSSAGAKTQPHLSSLSFLTSRGSSLQRQLGEGGQPPEAGARGPLKRHYGPVPEDFDRFRGSLELLLVSDSVAVVVSACAAIQCLFPSASWDCVVLPLLRCLYTCPVDFKEPLLRVIASFVSVCPRLFYPHLREFYLKQSDAFPVRQQKLSLLYSLAMAYPSCLATLLPELRVYVHWAGDEQLRTCVFRLLTLLALRHKQAQAYCMRLFVSLLDSGSAGVAAEAVVGVRTLVQQKQDEQDADTLARLVLHLAAQLSKITSPPARASVVWVVGKHHAQVSWVAADALRQLTKGFMGEAEEVKLQILLLATRLWAFHLQNMREGPVGAARADSEEASVEEASPQHQQQSGEQRLIPPPTREQSKQHFPRLDAMLRFLLEMAAYDQSHDVRDVARLYVALTSALSRPEVALPEGQRDMRRFANQFLHSLSSFAPPPGAPVRDLGKQQTEEGLATRDGGAPPLLSPPSGADTEWPWSYLSFHTGLALPGDIPLPAFASEDSAASLRQSLTEDEALRQSFLSLGVKPPPQGGPCASGHSLTTQGPRSICSADIIRQENAATLMGRADGGKTPFTEIDLDSFYENDPLADLAHLNGTSSASANSTECTGTRSSGVCAGEGGPSDLHHEALWAAFDGSGEAGADTGMGVMPSITPVGGIVAGEDDESEDSRQQELQRQDQPEQREQQRKSKQG